MGRTMPVSAGTRFDIHLRVRVIEMRTYLAPLVFAGCALSASPAAAATPSTDALSPEPAVPVTAQHGHAVMPGLRDDAAMVLVGTALIGLAAAVRRAA
jgi:hypothetical protein